MRHEQEMDILNLSIDFWHDRRGLLLSNEDVRELTEGVRSFFSLLDSWDKEMPRHSSASREE